MLSMKKYLCAAALAAFASNAFAEEEANLNESKLTGDWGGARKTLADKGIDIEIADRFDVFATVSGGADQGATAFNNLDLIFSIDNEKLFGVKGSSAMFHLFDNRGGHPDANFAGTAQGFNNYEVPQNTTQVYQAWLQQNFLDDKLSVLAGIYDFNTEFNVNESALLFIHSTYGMNTELALSGQNGPSIFPFTGLGGRIKVQPNDNFYAMVSATDGFPGARNDLSGTHIGVHDNDGWFGIAEAGFIPGGKEATGKFAVGAWYYTEKMADFVGGGTSRDEGFYVMGEHKLCEKLTGFARLGFANGDVQQFDYSWSTGVVYAGLIPGRDEGLFGFGVNGAHNSSDFRQANGPADSSETAFEITYADNLTPWLNIQPDLQYIVNPGTTPGVDDAWVVGTRFLVQF